MAAIAQTTTNDWTIFHGDCCEVMPDLPDKCIDFSVFSPPFSNLFVYSNSERDMGNCASDEEFMTHFRYMVRPYNRCGHSEPWHRRWRRK